MKLSELKQEEIHLAEQLAEVRRNIHDIEQKRCYDSYGVREGSIVRTTKGDEYLVTRVRPWPHSAPSLCGRKKKKDGEFAARVTGINGGWGNSIDVVAA